jgi:hypothetical protein
VRERERTRFLHGPHRAPSLRVGERATCLFKDGDVTVTSWTDGVGRTDNPGSARLIRAASQKGADEMRRKDWPAQARGERRERAVQGNCAARLQPGNHGPRWTQGQLALLGTDADELIAARIGKSRDAVRAQRVRRKIPPKR